MPFMEADVLCVARHGHVCQKLSFNLVLLCLQNMKTILMMAQGRNIDQILSYLLLQLKVERE